MARMMQFLAFAFLLCSAGALKIASPTQKDVDAEKVKLEKMSTLLGGMLSSKALSHSKVAPALKLFAHNLESALNETKSMKPSEALKKLKTVRASVAGLVSEMTKAQESLMKDNFEQQESLLMGVLMTHRNESMDMQMEILKSDDFGGLDVSKTLMHTRDHKTPLYMQAAQYLDAHKNASGKLVMTVASHANRVEAMAASLDRRVAALEKEFAARELHHKKKVDELKKLANSAGKDAKYAKIRIKREEHTYKKWAAMQKHDIESMKAAAAAVRSGDVKALNRARAALQASLEALKNKNGGMVVFLQQGSSILEQDCPYCAAQCVEKCHNKGESYVACLSECADAGK